jgi:hypothetical protein
VGENCWWRLSRWLRQSKMLNSAVMFFEHVFIRRKSTDIPETIRSLSAWTGWNNSFPPTQHFVVGYYASTMISQTRSDLLGVESFKRQHKSDIKLLNSVGVMRGEAKKETWFSRIMSVTSKFLEFEYCSSNTETSWFSSVGFADFKMCWNY